MATTRWTVALVAALALLPAFLAPATADSTFVRSALPSPITKAGVISSTGGYGGVILGGDDGALRDEILQHTAASDEFVVSDEVLPTPRRGMGSVTTGWYERGLVIGGEDAGGLLDDIVSFDRWAEDMVTLLPTALPSPRTEAAVTLGESWHHDSPMDVAIVGGLGASGPLDEIVLYHPDPEGPSIEVLAATLPTGRHAATAAWKDQWFGNNGAGTLYVFGGLTASGPTDEIVRLERGYYDWQTEVTVLTVMLPTPRYGMTLQGIDGRWFLLGGTDGTEVLDEILMFDPATETLVTVDAQLQQATAFAAAMPVRSGRPTIGLYGGEDASGPIEALQEYDFVMDAPRDLVVQTGALPGSVELSWTAPENVTGFGVSGYYVYRALAPGAEEKWLGVVTDTSFVDDQAAAETSYVYRVAAHWGYAPGSASYLGRFTPWTSGSAYLVGDSPAPQGLVAWWRGENTPYDEMGRNDATLAGTYPRRFGDGVVGRAMNLSSGYRLNVSDAPELHPTAQGFSVEAWVKGWPWHGGLVLSKGAGCDDPTEYELSATSSHVYWGSASAAGGMLAAPANIGVNEWAHVAATYDGSTLAVYVDGKLAGSKPGMLGPTNAHPLRLGHKDCSYFAPAQRIDELSLYGRALAPDEVRAVYLAGRHGKTAPPPGPQAVEVVDRMPERLWFVGAVADGAGSAFLLGGGTSRADGALGSAAIRHVNLTTGETTTLPVTLPTTRSLARAVWDGNGTAYLLGGHDGGSWSDDIVAFRPDNLSTWTLPLPAPTFGWDGVAFHDGSAIYAYESGYMRFHRIDTVAGTSSVPTLVRDEAKQYYGGAYVGNGLAYLVAYASIDRYDIATGVITEVLETPVPLFTDAVWDGAGTVYLSPPDGAILRFDLPTETLSEVRSAMPSGRQAATSIWDPVTQSAVFFGGHDEEHNTLLDEIVRFTPPTSAALELPDVEEPVESATADDARTGGDASDDPAQPTAVWMHGASQDSFEGNVTPVQDPVDAYRFDVEPGTGGETFCLALTPLSLQDLKLTMTTPDGHTVASDAGGRGAAESLCAPAGHQGFGAYTIVVEDVSLNADTVAAVKPIDLSHFVPGATGTYRVEPDCHPQCR